MKELTFRIVTPIPTVWRVTWNYETWWHHLLYDKKTLLWLIQPKSEVTKTTDDK